MKFIKQITRIIFLFSLFILPSSCLGLSLSIVLNDSGSGYIDLEYRFSKSLDSLGRLDGNERWLTIPVGMADFERTMERLPGLKLLSFSESEDERDKITNARIEYDSILALLTFLDSHGSRTSFSGDSGSGSLKLILGSDSETIANNPGFERLLAEVFNPYSVNISMRYPNGRTESHSFSLNEILSNKDEVIVEFNW